MIKNEFKDKPLITFYQYRLLFLHDMVKTEYKVIGIMSGTSLDGVDIICATFGFNTVWHYTIHYVETVPYNTYWVNALQSLVTLSKEALEHIDEEYTLYLSNIIKVFINNHNIKNVDAVCSHGHTALHQPQEKITYQIGNQLQLASLLKHTVVCDFRVQDVQLGGQGAPLVPIGDELLFSEYDYCLNLGGFANISTKIHTERIAYDICPANIVLNYYVKQLGFDFDDKGKIASTGGINNKLLQQLNTLEFYKQEYPKSLGFEWVTQNIFPLIDTFQLEVKDILRTFIEHIAIQISAEINKKSNASVLITGGGAFNDFLMHRIQSQTNNSIVLPNKIIIEYKEALIFGFLGVLKLRNEVNCLSSVTGAKHNHSSGKIFHP